PPRRRAVPAERRAAPSQERARRVRALPLQRQPRGADDAGHRDRRVGRDPAGAAVARAPDQGRGRDQARLPRRPERHCRRAGAIRPTAAQERLTRRAQGQLAGGGGELMRFNVSSRAERGTPCCRGSLALLGMTLLFVLAAQASETITVHYVEVPLSVVDRDGNPVRGLTKENFRLFDNRRPVDVTSFETIDFASPASLQANAKNPAAHRAFLLLFDLINSQPSSLGRAQAAARTFVQKTVLPGDLVGVGTLDLQHGYRLLVNFTSDRAAVAQAIDHPGALRSTDPLQLSAIPSLDKQQIDRDQGSNESAKEGAYSQWLRSDAERFRMEEDQRARQKVHQQIDWLGQLAASLRN